MKPSESTSKPTSSDDASKEASRGEKSKLGSIVTETRGLVSDLKEWVDIRVQLFQLEIEERIEQAFSKVISLVAVGVLLLFTLLFLMMALAEAIGTWLGHVAWGYLIVGLVFGLISLVVNLVRPRFSLKSDSTASEEPKAVPKAITEAKATPEPKSIAEPKEIAETSTNVGKAKPNP